MTFVWTTSYLCVFMLGGIATLFTSLKVINVMTNREEKKLREAAEKLTLQEKLAPYTVTDPLRN